MDTAPDSESTPRIHTSLVFHKYAEIAVSLSKQFQIDVCTTTKENTITLRHGKHKHDSKLSNWKNIAKSLKGFPKSFTTPLSQLTTDLFQLDEKLFSGKEKFDILFCLDSTCFQDLLLYFTIHGNKLCRSVHLILLNFDEFPSNDQKLVCASTFIQQLLLSQPNKCHSQITALLRKLGNTKNAPSAQHVLVYY